MPLTITAETSSSILLPHTGLIAKAVLWAGRDSMPEKKSARFPREKRLLRHADFQRVYKQGRRHFSANMTVFYWARPEAGEEAAKTSRSRPGAPVPHGPRIGFTVGRVLGGAVQRNRMKRRLREAVRLTLPVSPLAVDVVINPKKTILAVEFTAVVGEMERAFAVIEQKLAPKVGAQAIVGAPHKS